jgi:hypothetical protein
VLVCKSRPQESEQDDKWSFCLTAGTLACAGLGRVDVSCNTQWTFPTALSCLRTKVFHSAGRFRVWEWGQRLLHQDYSGHAVAYVYCEEEPGRRALVFDTKLDDKMG